MGVAVSFLNSSNAWLFGISVKVKVVVQEGCDAAKEGGVTIDVLDPRIVTAIQETVSKSCWPRLMWKGREIPISENEVSLV